MMRNFFTIVFLLLTMSVGFAGESNVSEEAPQQFQGFNLQGYTDGGSKAWDVNGDTADILGNLIKLTNINANMYGETPTNLTAKTGNIEKDSGKVHLEKDVVITSNAGDQMTTDSLDWHRTQDLITTKDFVTITNEKLQATGTGMEAHPNLKIAQLNQDVTVHFHPEQQKPGEDQTVTITSDGPLEIDQVKNTAVFHDNVVAIQIGRELKADIMEIFFDPSTKKIKKIVCTGHVEVTQGGNKSFSDKAVYSADDQRLVLSGQPKLILMSSNGEGGKDQGLNIFGQLGNKK